MGATTTTVDKILKEKYVGPIQEAMTQGRVLLEKMDRNSEDYDGKKIVIPVNSARNAGLGGAAEDGTLPTAGSQAYVDATYTPEAVYGRGQISGHAMRHSKTDAGSFARALDRELRNLERDFKNDCNRILNGNGDEILTRVNGTTGSQTAITVDSTRFLNAGDTILIDTDSATISSVDSDTTITISSAVTVADNDAVKRRIGSTTVVEPDGIQNVIDDDNTFGTIDRTSALYWQAKVLDNGGTLRDLGLDDMDQLTREVEKRTNEMPDNFYCKQELRDVYGALLQADKRYNSTTLSGGKKNLTHNDVPFLTDFHAADNTIFAPKWSSFGLVEAGPVDFMDKDGSTLSRVVNKDAYEYTLVWEFQTVGYNPRENASLTDLSETVPA
ncbi:MAG: phage major capsid protein [Gemmatimonadaceae bacterium]|nr:phage major capsid protein [Gemmatimonadaceae bacterium]